MTARRSQLGLAAAVGILAILLAAVVLRQGGEDLDPFGGPAQRQAVDGDAVPGRSGEPDRGLMPRSDAGAAAEPGGGGRERLVSRSHTAVVGPVDLIIVDEKGVGLLDRAKSSLAPDVIFWLEPVLIEGRNVPATVPAGAKRLRRKGSTVSSTPGWYTAFDRPAGDAHAALLFGDRIVSIEPIQPGSDEVVLVATEADIAALQCSVRGAMTGLTQAGHHVRVQPLGRAGQVLAPILGQGEGERFEVTKIPPGRAQLLVRFDPGVLVQELIQSAPPGSPVSLGARVPDAEQWRIRLEALGRIHQPWLVMDLELVPGEDRDLGRLVASGAGAILLSLVDDEGEPVPAHGVDVRLLTSPPNSIPKPQTWTYGNQAILHPVPMSLLQMTVVQGDLGVFLSVRPSALGLASGGGGFPETQGVLSPLSVVALPRRTRAGKGGVRLLTESGAELATDPRWSGGRFKGHTVDEATMLVPAGRYRFEGDAGQGTLTSIEVAPGMFVDLRDAVVASSPLQPAGRKVQEARR